MVGRGRRLLPGADGGLLLDVPLSNLHGQPGDTGGRRGRVPHRDRVRRVRGTLRDGMGGELLSMSMSMLVSPRGLPPPL